MPLFKKHPPLKLHVDEPSSIELRPYNKDTDYQAVIDMIASRYPEVETHMDLDDCDKDLLDVDRYWREPGGEFMVLTRNGEVIGSICGQPLKENPEVAWFTYFFLKRKEEGKGLGLKLLKWALDWCMQKNIKRIELWTNERRKPAHKIYKKIGFKQNGVKKLYQREPEEVYLLYFELDLTDKKRLKQLQQETQAINF